MARLARISIVNIPYHVTQRGNARQFILASDNLQRWGMQDIKIRRLIAICFVIAVFLIAATSSCVSQETAILGAELSCKAERGSLRSSDLTLLGFTIGASTIRDVQKQFSNTKSTKLTREEEGESGVCIKNEDGIAAIFATSVMGAPDTLTAVYLAPSRLVEGPNMTCQRVKLPSKMFASKSGIRIGVGITQLSRIVPIKRSGDGLFCVAREIESDQGILKISKSKTAQGFSDFTGVEGNVRGGRLEWVKIFGVASN